MFWCLGLERLCFNYLYVLYLHCLLYYVCIICLCCTHGCRSLIDKVLKILKSCKFIFKYLCNKCRLWYMYVAMLNKYRSWYLHVEIFNKFKFWYLCVAIFNKCRRWYIRLAMFDKCILWYLCVAILDKYIYAVRLHKIRVWCLDRGKDILRYLFVFGRERSIRILDLLKIKFRTCA